MGIKIFPNFDWNVRGLLLKFQFGQPPQPQHNKYAPEQSHVINNLTSIFYIIIAPVYLWTCKEFEESKITRLHVL